MAAKGLSVVIAATDRATGVINKVNAGFDAIAKRTAGVSAAGDRFGAAFRTLGEKSGLTRAAQDAGVLAQRVARATISLGRFAPGLTAVTGAGSIAGLAALTNRWTEFGSELQRNAVRAGLSADHLQALQGAARLTGASAEAAAEGMTTLQDGLTNAVSGRAPEVVMMLSSLGIAFTNASGGARNAEEVLPEVADKIAKLRNPTLQARAATALFGGAAGALLPFLRRGSEGLAEYTAEARRYGVMNDAGVEAARRFGEAQTRVGLAAEGVGYAISERLAPVLIPLLDRLATWVSSHREDIAGFFGDMAKRFDEWVKGDGPERMWANLKNVGTEVNGIVKALGGWKTAAEIIGAVMVARVLAPVVAVSAAVAKLILAVGTTLVQAFGTAGVAAEGLNTRAMALPLFRIMAITMGVMDKIGEGIPVENLDPSVRAALGLPAAGGGGGVGAGEGSSGKWFNNQVNRPAGAGPLPGPVQPMGPITNSPYNNNNPTNLAYYPGQRGVMGANGRWGVYGTPEAGVAAGLDQMLRDSEQKGFRTLADEIQHRSPPGENNTLGMIRDISTWSGIKPDEDLNLRDPARAQRFLEAVIRREQGRAPDPEMVRRGVGTVLGTGPAATPVAPAVAPPPLAPPVATVPPPGAAAPSGGSQGPAAVTPNAHVRFSFENPPEGLRSQIVNTGGGLRIEMPTPGSGVAP